MNKFILILIAICISTSLLVGCISKVNDTNIDIKIGTPRKEVIELLGEPQGTLSGFYGDIYKMDNSKIIIYYEARVNSDDVVSDVKIFDKLLNFSFDENGYYTGFSDIPSNYTIEEAKSDGYFTTQGLGDVVNQDEWDRFVNDSSNKKDASIRMVRFFKESIDSPYFLDLFYKDGHYYAFNSSEENQEKNPFLYLLTLEGKFGNPLRDTGVILLTDDNTLTFDMVMKSALSSDMNYKKSIPPFKLIMFK